MRHETPQYPTTSPMEYIKQNNTVKSQSMQILSKHEPFVTAVESPIGQELLKDLVSMHSQLLSRIASLDATDEEKQQYRIVTELIKRWSIRIEQYENSLKAISYNNSNGGK